MNSSPRLWLVSEQSISFVLQRGRNVIHAGRGVAEGYLTCNVGIIPLYEPARISTRGLEWDVQDWETSMGRQVSTSNHVVAERVEVKTDERVLFTVEMVGELP